jgi:uncharacterized membrane protein
METLIWFVTSLVALVYVVRWIHQHLHGIAYLWTGNPGMALLLYALPLLPGVLLHEVSHAVMAILLRVRISDLSIVPRRDSRGHISLGSVMVEQVDPVRSSLIGLAPLLFGSGAVLLIGHEVFGLSELGSVILSGEGPAIGAAISRLFQTPDAALWLYLIFAVSNAMLPSASDREPWPPVILFILSAFALVLVADQGAVLQAMAQPVNAAITWLTAAFIITLAINIPVMVLIALLERGSEQISGRRIYYRKPGDDD